MASIPESEDERLRNKYYGRITLPELCSDIRMALNGAADPVSNEELADAEAYLHLRLRTWRPTVIPRELPFDEAVRGMCVSVLELIRYQRWEENRPPCSTCGTAKGTWQEWKARCEEAEALATRHLEACEIVLDAVGHVEDRIRTALVMKVEWADTLRKAAAAATAILNGTRCGECDPSFGCFNGDTPCCRKPK